jgi:TonB-dependent siderophore receptor
VLLHIPVFLPEAAIVVLLIRLIRGNFMFQHPTVRRTILTACLLAAFSANAEQFDFNLPVQDLAASLESISGKSHVRLMYSPEAVKGISAPALIGQMTPEQALERLLQGTGLTWSVTDGVIAIKTVHVNAAPSALREVVVTATKTERAQDDVPVAMSVITSKEIAQKGGYIDLSDVLQGQAGLDVQRSTTTGLAGLSVRGLGSVAHSLILIDGQPADLMSYSGRSPLQIIDPSNVERVEIVRGAASSLYGSNAMSGVVNIITKHGKGDGKTRVTVGYDTLNSPLAIFSTNGVKDEFTYNVSLRHFRTQGFNMFPGNEIPWATTTVKTDWGDDALGAKFGYTIKPGTELSLGVNYQDSFSHKHGWDNQAFFKQHFDALELKHQVNDVYRVIANLSYRKHDARYIWGYTPTSSVTDEITTKTRLDLQNQFDFSEANRFILGMEYGVENVDWVTFTTPGTLGDTAKSKSGDLGVYVQDEWKPNQNLFVTVGGRYDRFRYSDAQYTDYSTATPTVASGSGDQSAFNPRIGAKLKVAESTALRASAGTGFRAPTASDRYQQTYYSIANPDLKPERSRSYDAGVDHEFSNGLNVAATLYYIQLIDAITSYAQPSGMWQANNVNRAVSKGLELEMKQPINDEWSVSFNYSNSNARITEQLNDPTLVGHQMTNAPHIKANAAVVYDLFRQYTFRLDGLYTGSMYTSVQNTESGKLGGYFLMNVKGTWHISRVKDGFDISAGVTNLANRTYYRFQPYWHEPGRVAYVEAAYKW